MAGEERPSCVMRIFRRRSVVIPNEAALADARRATTKVRRENATVERYRAKKQTDPANQMTANQWIGSGN